MTFRRLSEYFKLLEQNSSRLKITEILAALFKEANGEEIDKICYLSLGKLLPAYEGLEFQMAEKTVIRAIAKAFGINPEEVQREYKRVGDLGEVGEKFKIKSQKLKVQNKLWDIEPHFSSESEDSRGKELEVLKVYERLMEIAREAGAGSVERKVDKLAALIEDLDTASVRFIVRIPLGKLRLGFSEMTILDALSWMEKKDKSLRIRFEDAFNVLADIGEISQRAKTSGIRGVTGVKPKVGTPIMPALSQRLGMVEEMLEKVGDISAGSTHSVDSVQASSPQADSVQGVAVEPKYDGQRCVGGMTGIYLLSKGFTPARDVKTGDLVLTHKGEFHLVSAVNKRMVDKKEKIYLLQTFLGDGFKISGDHRILVHRGEKEAWEPVDSLKEDDWLVFPQPQMRGFPAVPSSLKLIDDAGYQKTIIFNEDFFRFLGFWIGDGFTNKNVTNKNKGSKRIGICFNRAKERDLAKEYEKIIKDVLKVNKIRIEEGRGALNLYWSDKLFQHWLCKEFRINQHGKTIPPWFFNISSSFFDSFLKGWIEADGTERHSHGIRLTTKERELASFVQLLCLSLGRIAGLRRERIKLPKRNYSRIYYSLIFPGTKKYAFWKEKKLLVKVMKVRPIRRDPRTTLYNFKVENNESYATSLVCLHNCQIHLENLDQKSHIRLFTRNLENVTNMFPDIVGTLGKEVRAKNTILDSEVVGYDPKTNNFLPFQETIKRKRKHQVSETAKEIPLKAFVFDIMYYNGESLIQTPFWQRRKILEKILPVTNKTIILSPQIITNDPKKMREYHDKQIKKGLEGVMVKKINAPYDPGRRGFTWVKFKQEETKKGGGLADTVDCVVMGITRGRGKRATFGVGSFLVGVRKRQEFVTVTNIGTGLSDNQFRELNERSKKLKVKAKPKDYLVDKNQEPDIWVEPKIVVEIQADNITKSPIHTAGLALRFPRLVNFRDDKSVEQISTVKEVESLYQMQFAQEK